MKTVFINNHKRSQKKKRILTFLIMGCMLYLGIGGSLAISEQTNGKSIPLGFSNQTRHFLNHLITFPLHCFIFFLELHVIENCKTNKIVASGTIFVEQKLIRNYGKVGHIEDIVVDESCRGYGLGKKMIEYLSNIGKDMECYKCILDCDDKNTGFYERCGYVRKGAEMSKYM